jgi:phytoene synthase
MPVAHYENFPVASWVLPRHLHAPVTAIYRFARTADDFADEGDRTPAQRLALLDGYRDSLRRCVAGGEVTAPLFLDLQRVIARWQLDPKPFFDLLDAFSQDVTKTRYADYQEVLDYCARSANPVGRLMLRLYEAESPENLRASDSICTALQLINFWQDVAIDARKDRIYLPQEDLRRFGVDESQVLRGDASGGWRPLLQFEVNRARALLLSGAPLGTRLRGRIGLELRLIVAGGARILDKITRNEEDVFRRRPVLGAPDWIRMLYHALLYPRAA